MKELRISDEPIKQYGYLLPWDSKLEQPCFVTIDEIVFIPVFSDAEKLNAFIDEIAYKNKVYKKVITNTDEFLTSTAPHRIALDPRITERNTTRFTEIKRIK